jgi:ATP adenylyltransferase
MHPQGPVDPPVHSLDAPWRQSYLDTFKDEPAPNPPSGAKPAKNPGTGSFLLDYWLTPADDEKNHVIVRTTGEPENPGTGGIILLNKFPYAGGHLLVALGEARPRLVDYTPAQRAALWSLVDLAADLMERTLEPQGINIGINQGRAAGAGVPQHLHAHLVPRWGGDVNFMAAVGNVRVISTSLDAVAAKYRRTWQQGRGAAK